MIDGLGPYPEYKDSGLPWLGGIPRLWETGPGFAAFREKSVKNTGMQEKSVTSLSYGRIVVKPPEKLHGLVPASFETYQVVEPGDIIIRPTDLQNDWNSLRVGLVRDRGIITSAYLCFKTTGTLIPEYGYFLLHAFDLMKVFYGLGSGLRQNLDFSDFKHMLILVPSADEQAAIVRFLDYANGRIERTMRAKKKLIGLLTEQKQATIHRAVTRGPDPNVALKPSGIDWLGDIPAHWEAIRLKHVSRVQTGVTLGKRYRGQEVEGRPYLRVANVQTGRLDLRVVKTITVPPSEIAGSELKPGDVLMTEGGDIDKLARACVWRGEIQGCLHQNHIFAVRADRFRLLPDYLVALMASRHGRVYFQRTAKRTTNLASTNSSTLGAFPLILPDVEEQDRILKSMALETRSLDMAVDHAQREIDLIREYRTRLIADVVTGKLDVREAARHLPAASVGPVASTEPEEPIEEEDAEVPTAEE